MPNPFYFGGAIKPDLFIGRKSELRTIFNCLETIYTGQMRSVSIVGPHRMGRSSLLNYVVSCFPKFLTNHKQYRIAYISLHDAECHTPAGLLQKILLKLQIPINDRTITLVEFQNELEHLCENGINLVICLDEFEDLIQTGAFDNNFFESWRHLMSNNTIAFVIASTRPLEQLVQSRSLTSSFFNIFTIVELREFCTEEVELLVRRGLHCDHPFDEEDCRQMRLLGEHHPSKLQIAGEKIYLAKTETTRVNWRQVGRQVELQIRQAGLSKDTPRFVKKYSKVMLKGLRSIGRAILITRRAKDEISDDASLVWGVISILVVIALLVFGKPFLSLLLKFGAHWLGS